MSGSGQSIAAHGQKLGVSRPIDAFTLSRRSNRCRQGQDCLSLSDSEMTSVIVDFFKVGVKVNCGRLGIGATLILCNDSTQCTLLVHYTVLYCIVIVNCTVLY